MKKKIMIFAITAIALTLAIVLIVSMLTPKAPMKDSEKIENTSSTTSEVEVIIDDVDGSESSKNESVNDKNFIEPNESEADKVLENNKDKANSSTTTKTDNKKTESKKTESKKTTSKKDEPKSFEESKNDLENTASDYLKKHNIDPKTAGETGETCKNCGKKIWNPDKYGLFIPGMPENYENSGYCLGTCGITFG